MLPLHQFYSDCKRDKGFEFLEVKFGVFWEMEFFTDAGVDLTRHNTGLRHNSDRNHPSNSLKKRLSI